MSARSWCTAVCVVAGVLLVPGMKPFAGEGLLNLFSTHPPTEARIKALLGR